MLRRFFALVIAGTLLIMVKAYGQGEKSDQQSVDRSQPSAKMNSPLTSHYSAGAIPYSGDVMPIYMFPARFKFHVDWQQGTGY